MDIGSTDFGQMKYIFSAQMGLSMSGVNKDYHSPDSEAWSMELHVCKKC